jgi:acetolactate synthase-1/2/3 large subunit
MGFSNCAAVGCGDALNGDALVLAIIGDGSLPMNCQELAWLKRAKAKLVVIDNAGYGIIRMTQDDYYEGRHYGSEFGDSDRLPAFSVRQIIEGFGLSASVIDCCSATDEALIAFMQSSCDALVIQCPISDRVGVDFYE